MTNFNSINNLNFYISQRSSSLNPQQTKVGDDSSSANFQQNTQVLINNDTSINPALLYNMQSAKMDYEVMLKYILNMLMLPENIDKFIQKAAHGSKDNELVKLLVENLINTKALAEFLNKNSKIAIDKTLQMISSSIKSGMDDSVQLKEVLSILTAIQSHSQTNMNVLKDFLLLYIPVCGQIFDKQVEYSVDNSEEEKQIQSSELSLMFETINFSNILCTLSAENNDCYLTLFTCDIFPNSAFDKIMQAFSKEANLNVYLDFKLRKNSVKENSLQNFKIISKTAVQINVLILAHLIIKTIFKIDNDFI